MNNGPTEFTPELEAKLWKGINPQYAQVLGTESYQHRVLLTEIARLRALAEHWRHNHDAQVQRARVLLERPDLPLERVEAYMTLKELPALQADQRRLDLLDSMPEGVIRVDPSDVLAPQYTAWSADLGQALPEAQHPQCRRTARAAIDRLLGLSADPVGARVEPQTSIAQPPRQAELALSQAQVHALACQHGVRLCDEAGHGMAVLFISPATLMSFATELTQARQAAAEPQATVTTPAAAQVRAHSPDLPCG